MEGLERPVALPLRRRAVSGPARRQGAAALLGFAGGWVELFGSFSPFGMGLVLGADPDCVLPCAVGAGLALAFRLEGLRLVVLLCGVTAAAAGRLLWPRQYPLSLGLGCGAMLFCALGFVPMSGRSLLGQAGADALLAGGIGMLLRLSPPARGRSGALVALLPLFGFWAGVQLGEWNLGLSLSTLCLLVLCCRAGGRQALGLSAALAAVFAGVDARRCWWTVGLSCGTLAAGMTPPGEKLLTACAFGLGCLPGLLCAETLGGAVGYAFSVGLGCVGLLALPRPLLLRDADLSRALEENSERPRMSAAATRLGAVAESLADIGQTVNQVYCTLPRGSESFRWVIDNTYDSLCRDCGRRGECWEREREATLAGMEQLRRLFLEGETVRGESLPEVFARCVHPAELMGAVNRSFALFRSRQEARVHAQAMRTALTEQYGAVAQALELLSRQIGQPGTPEPHKSGRVAAFFASMGEVPLECSVTLDHLGRTRVAVTLPNTRFSPAELEALTGEVGQLCRRMLEPPQRLSCKGMTTLLFCEKPLLRAAFGLAGCPAKGSISGDAVRQFSSAEAAQMILCDGMGTGRPAAVDGNLAAELTARLLRAGFPPELAARLVNVALSIRGDEEGGATLDLLTVDLYTGVAQLFKAGAVPSFVVHGGRVRTVGEASLPVGILGSVNGQSRMVHLSAGDLAVLVSDGLLVDGTGWIVQQLELSAAAGEHPRQIARKLVDTARVRAERSSARDDITAAVLRLERS